MAYTKINRSETTHTKVVRPVSGKEARYAFAKFGSARFGLTDIYSKVTRPSVPTFSKVVRPE